MLKQIGIFGTQVTDTSAKNDERLTALPEKKIRRY